MLDLFDNWPTASPSADNVRAYVEAVEAFSLEAVQRSVKQFGSGLVERNNAFVPAAPELAENCRQWDAALASRAKNDVVLHNGLLTMDWGQGTVNMRGLTNEEQDRIIAAKGVGPDGKSLAYMPMEAIRAALAQPDLSQVEGGKTFKVPVLGRMA